MSKKSKKFTVPEFKTWLEGIMQFQNPEWSPNREQWEEIYSKIMDLKEPVTKEKMSLNQSTMDEINDIVYFHISDTLMNKMGNVMAQQRQPQPSILQPQPQLQPQPNMYQNPQQPPTQPNNADDLANTSLSELKKRQEDAASGVTRHKLPDRVDDSSLPEDFV